MLYRIMGVFLMTLFISQNLQAQIENSRTAKSVQMQSQQAFENQILELDNWYSRLVEAAEIEDYKSFEKMMQKVYPILDSQMAYLSQQPDLASFSYKGNVLVEELKALGKQGDTAKKQLIYLEEIINKLKASKK